MAGLPEDYVFHITGRKVAAYYLAPKALRGELPDDVIPGGVAEGVDVYPEHPAALAIRLPRCRRGDRGEVSRYFFSAAQSDGERRDVPGGLWMRYGDDKAYSGGDGGEAVAFRRRFEFFDGRGHGETARTEWRMKEYRLNKGAAAFLGSQFDPKAKDYVVCKVYNTGEIPEPPPLRLT